MFWQSTGYSQSPVDALLDRDEYTLEELLQEDDVIQETKGMNVRLIGFLKQRDIVQQLLQYLVQPAPDPSDNQRQFKYPFAACEILACEVDAIFTTLVEDDELMALLFSLLDMPTTPLDAMLAGYFARVMHSLLTRKTTDTLAYLQKQHTQLLPKLLQHIDTTSIAEVLVRVLGADEHTRVFLPTASLVWLTETNVLDLLLDRLRPEHSPNVQKAAADILTAIAETQLSPLAAGLVTTETINTLFERAFAVDATALVPALNICIAMVEPRTSARDAISPHAADIISAELENKMKTEAIFALVSRIPTLVQFLRSGAAASEQQDTPYGMLAPALGSARLKVVELLAALARTGIGAVESALLKAEAPQECMRLFTDYPFNNLLHRQVAGMLAVLLESEREDTLSAMLLPPVQVFTWLAGLPRELVPPNDGHQAPTLFTKRWRPGYMGHVVLLANKITELSLAREGIAKAAASAPGWNEFSASVREQNTLQSLDSWQCGRPSTMDMAGMDSEPEFEQELDLDPSTSGHTGPDYRYGGFHGGAAGSSDDDEGEAVDKMTAMTAAMAVVEEGEEAEEDGEAGSGSAEDCQMAGGS